MAGVAGMGKAVRGEQRDTVSQQSGGDDHRRWQEGRVQTGEWPAGRERLPPSGQRA